MAAKTERRRHAPDPETNTSLGEVADDLRRRDPPETRPDVLPPRDRGEVPAGGGFTPTEDGGNPQHPIHDEDQEDRTPSDYEREIDRLDAAIANRIG
jgi:hypothetical protein